MYDKQVDCETRIERRLKWEGMILKAGGDV